MTEVVPDGRDWYEDGEGNAKWVPGEVHLLRILEKGGYLFFIYELFPIKEERRLW